MLTCVFSLALLWAIWKIIVLGLKLTWGIMKFAFSVVVFPLVVIGIFVAGLAYIALPIVIIVGVLALLAGKTTAA